MARRKTRRSPQKAQHLAWDAELHPQCFRLGAVWSPPEVIQMRQTQRGVTLTAVFTDPEGQPWKAVTRMAWTSDRKLRLVEETVTTSFKVGGRNG